MRSYRLRAWNGACGFRMVTKLEVSLVRKCQVLAVEFIFADLSLSRAVTSLVDLDSDMLMVSLS